MKQEMIDSSKFDTFFQNLLKVEKHNKTIIAKYDIEPVKQQEKIDFIEYIINSFKPFFSITYKILFWEKSEIIQQFIDSNKEKTFLRLTNYKGGKDSGTVFVDDDYFDKTFFEALLINHFNFEMAEDPSMNIRVQICISSESKISIIDIYDDRGFNIYYLLQPMH